ncbi:cation diffusion facilitator family transporter [bacterium]|nr:cation diffusion facilitator family transporter [bacterium]
MHSHGQHNHPYGSTHHADSGLRALFAAFLINLVFLIAEVIGGIISGSMALLADAGHMLSDVVALGIAVWVARAMKRPPSSRRSYGYGRLEVLSGFVNGLILWGIVIFIAVEAVRRLMTPQHVEAGVMLPIAVAGLVANVASAALLFRGRREDLNMRQAFLHLSADAAGSIGAILASLALLYGIGMWVDTAASLLIGALIAWSSWGMVKDSGHILLEGTPVGVDLEDIRRTLESLPGIEDVHDLHAWSIGSGEPIMTAHLVPADGYTLDEILQQSHETLRTRYNIQHTTFQVESGPCPELHP